MASTLLRLVAAVALLSCGSLAAKNPNTNFYGDCDTAGCIARCIEFVGIDPEGLGMNYDALINGTSTIDYANPGETTLPFSFLERNASTWATRALRACATGCQSYTVEPAACDMRCAAYVQDAVDTAFTIPTTADEWFSALLSNESQLLEGGLNFQSISLLLGVYNTFVVNGTEDALEDVETILRGLGLPDSIEDPILGLIYLAFNRVQIVTQLDNFCTAGCHYQQTACRTCLRDGGAPGCACTDDACTQCGNGKCQKCLPKYFKMEINGIDHCMNHKVNYNGNGEGEEGQGEDGNGSNNYFEELDKDEKKKDKKTKNKNNKNSNKKNKAKKLKKKAKKANKKNDN